MAQSGNTVALKSFQSFMVNDGLLSKTVEAIKAGEKEARSTGNVQSFEVFYKGFASTSSPHPLPTRRGKTSRPPCSMVALSAPLVVRKSAT